MFEWNNVYTDAYLFMLIFSFKWEFQWKLEFILLKTHALYGSLSPRIGASSSCGLRKRPPDVDGSCEYIE
jgi:hypothetical protein